MPPKKKSKKSKAELEAERLEAERQEALASAERERKAAEEQRLAEEAAQALAQQRRQVREEELAALALEIPDDEAYFTRRAAELQNVRRRVKEEVSWNKLLECSRLPSAESDPELNTYLSELLDEVEASAEVDLDLILKKVATTQKIAAALVDLEANARAQGDADSIDRCSNFVRNFRKAVIILIDRASAHVLQHADAPEQVARDKNEVFVTGADIIPPIARDMHEPMMAMAGVSPQSVTSAGGINTDLSRPPSNAALEHKASSTINIGAASGFARSAFSSLLLGVKEKEDKKRITLVRCDQECDSDDTRPTHNFDFQRQGAVRVGIWANLCVKSNRGPFKQLNFGDINLNLDLPKTLGTQRIGARIVYLPFEYVPQTYAPDAVVSGATALEARVMTEELQEGLIRACDMMVVGGVILVEILELPPMRKEIKPRLVMQHVTELSRNVRVQHFPPGTELGAYVPVDKIAAPALNQYLRVRLGVPEGIILPSDEGSLHVAWWDTARRSWIDGTTSQVEYNSSKREVGFIATRSGVLAVVQPRTMDLPYKAWALEASQYGGPSENEMAQCRLTLETPRFRLLIDITSTGDCRLVAPVDVDDLRELLNRNLSPGCLIRALRRTGINVAPDGADEKVSTSVKSPLLEKKLCTEMAALASGFDFRNCPAGVASSAGRIAIQVRETDVFVGDNPAGEAEFMTLLVERDVLSKTQREAPDVVGDAPELKCSLVLGVPGTQQTPICQASSALHDMPQSRIEEHNNEAIDTATDAAAQDGQPQQSDSITSGPAGDVTDAAKSRTADASDATSGVEVAQKSPSVQEAASAEGQPVAAPGTPVSASKNEPQVIFKEDLLPGQTSHVGLMPCLRQVSSIEAMDRVVQAPIVFQQAITELLHLTRPFSFTEEARTTNE